MIRIGPECFAGAHPTEHVDAACQGGTKVRDAAVGGGVVLLLCVQVVTGGLGGECKECRE